MASRATLPLRSTTQMCVSFIEMSNPAKYSMIALLFTFGSRSYRPPGEQPPHYSMLQKSAIGEGLVGIQQDVEAIAEARPEEGRGGTALYPYAGTTR